MDALHDRSAIPTRGHRSLPHTADVGIEAWGPDLPALFEEAGLALADLTGEGTDAVPAGSDPVAVELSAADLVGLAFSWLNTLVSLIDIRGALAAVQVHGVSVDGEGARLAGEVRFVPFDGRTVRRGHDVKSATYHRLVVEGDETGWRMVAYLDL
jgi:SHS2 domain-containing protein